MGLYETYKALQEREGSIKLNVNPHTQLITASYIHSGVDFSNTLYRQARGLTFTKKGEIILRGFDKFFNHMELEGYDTYTEEFKDTYARIQGNQDTPLLAQEKKDGTMVLVGLYEGELVIGTTSSTDNPYVTQVGNYLEEDWLRGRIMHRYLEKQDKPVTLIFEYTGPGNQIVVPYTEEELTLLARVDNHTGSVTDFEETKKVARKLYGVKTPDVYTLTLGELQDLQKTKKGIEGFVVLNGHNKRVKVKTDDWFEQSAIYGVFFTNTLTQNVIKTVVGWYVNDELDDFNAYQNQHTRYREENLIGRVLAPLYELQEEVQFTIQEIESRTHLQTRKQIVEWVRNNARPIIQTHLLSQEDIYDIRTLKHAERFYSKYLITYFSKTGD